MEKKKKRFFDGVKTKLIAAMLLSVIIPVAITTCISLFSAMGTATENMDAMNTAQVNLVEHDFAEIVEVNKIAIESVARSSVTQDLLRTVRDGGKKVTELVDDGTGNMVPTEKIVEGTLEQDKQEVLEWLTDLDAAIGDGNALIVSDAEGHQIIRTQGECVDIADREYYIRATQDKKFYASDISISRSTGQRICTFIVPVFDKDGSTVIGTVQRNYDLADFHTLVASEVTEENMDILIVDKTGSVVAHSAREIPVESPEDQSYQPFFTNGDNKGDYDISWDGVNWRVSYQKEENTGWISVVARDTSVSLRSTWASVWISLLVSLVLLVIVGIVAWMLANYFTKPIRDTVAVLLAMAGGSFAGVKGYEHRRDEFGDISSSVNNVSDELMGIVSGIKTDAENVGKAAGDIATRVEQLSQAAQDVSGAVDNVSQGAVSQAEEVEQATIKSTEMQSNMEEVSSLIENLAATSQQMADVNQGVSSTLANLIDSARENQEAIVLVTDNVRKTNAAVDEISNAAEAIMGIASQTNLLSLNASIEAARAGEAGRGFAVVAEEIRKLSEESSASAGQIAEVLKRLIDASGKTLASAQSVKEATENQGRMLNDTETAVRQLSESVDAVSGMAEQVASKVETANSNVMTVSDALSNLSAITQENAASAEETNASMQEMSATMSTITGETEELKALADEVSNALMFFK